MKKYTVNNTSIKTIIAFVIGVLLITLSWHLIKSITNLTSAKEFNNRTITSIEQKKRILNEPYQVILNAINANKTDSLFQIFTKKIYKNLDSENIFIQLKQNDSLTFWTSNKLNFNDEIDGYENSKIKLFKNGWYYVSEEKVNQFKIISYIKIKNQFSVQNNFLKNNFLLFNLNNQDIEIFGKSLPNTNNVIDEKNNYLFSYKLSIEKNAEIDDVLPFVLLTLGIYFILIFIDLLLSIFITNRALQFTIIGLTIVTLRTITIQYPNYFFWNIHSLFNPKYFAISSINSSIGNYLLNILIIHFIVEKISQKINFKFKNKFSSRIFFFFSVLFIVALTIPFTYYISVLVTDSNINFNFDNLIELNSITLIAVTIIGIICNTYYLILSIFTNKLINQITIRELLILLASMLFIGILLSITQFEIEASIFIFIAILLGLFYVFNKSNFINTTYSKVVFFTSVFAIWSSLIINNKLVYKKQQTSKLLAEKLSVEKDNVAENLFTEVVEKIKTDSTLNIYLYKSEKQKTLFFKRLTEKYFNGYWDKFEMRVYVYDVACNQIAKSTNANDEKLNVFEEVCGKKELESSAKNLFYVPTENDEDAGLLCKFIFKNYSNITDNPLTIYIQFTIKYNADEIGFPSLFLDKKIGQSKEKFSGFSYAKYKYNLLVPISKNNTYNYPLKSDFIEKASIKKQMIFTNFF